EHVDLRWADGNEVVNSGVEPSPRQVRIHLAPENEVPPQDVHQCCADRLPGRHAGVHEHPVSEVRELTPEEPIMAHDVDDGRTDGAEVSHGRVDERALRAGPLLAPQLVGLVAEVDDVVLHDLEDLGLLAADDRDHPRSKVGKTYLDSAGAVGEPWTV